MAAMTDAERVRALVESELMMLRDLEAARDQIKELRAAVVAVCDTYSSNRSEKLKVKAYRYVAAKGEGPFTKDAVDAELAELERRERDIADVLDEVLSRVDTYEESYRHPTPAEVAAWRKVLRAGPQR